MAGLLYGTNLEMIRLDTIRASNAQAESIRDLVVVFIGGTGGVGEATARELFLRATRPKAYIIGRNETQGNTICNELHEINSEGTAVFIQRDISTLRACDELCAELRERESRINCLCLTAGYMALDGRRETVEGLDRKMCVNYYSRDAGEISRVITVLAAGSEGDVDVDDLDLRNRFTLHACLAHCVVMTDFIIEELAKRHPGTSFSHSYPGTVKSGIANELSGAARLAVKVVYTVMAPWILQVRESGERHFFQITSKCYPSAKGSQGVPIPKGLSVFAGTDGVQGSGAYLLDWDGRPAGDESVLRKYRDMNFGPLIWEHTMRMFDEAGQKGRKNSKRAATDEAEGSERTFSNPIGWRPA